MCSFHPVTTANQQKMPVFIQNPIQNQNVWLKIKQRQTSFADKWFWVVTGLVLWVKVVTDMLDINNILNSFT